MVIKYVWAFLVVKTLCSFYTAYHYIKIATVKFDVIGVHIEMGFPNMDFSEADAFVKKWY